MKSKLPLIIGVMLVAIILIVGGVLLIISNNNKNREVEQLQTAMTEIENSIAAEIEEAQQEMLEENEYTGPVPFSKVGKGIMDATDDYDYFSFENGTGTCMAQNFPTDLVYGPGNYVNTLDGTYSEDLTMVDFLGRIRFDSLPLSTGSAACMIETSSSSDTASVSCSVDEVEVCTATFDVFGIRE